MYLLQSAKLENETFPNPYYLYFPIASTIAYMVVSMRDDRVLFRVLSDKVLFRVLLRLRVLSDGILFRVLSPSFLACRMPSVASTTWGILQWCSVINISTATDVLILSLVNLMQSPEIWASFWKEEKGFILHFWLGSQYPYAESFIFRSIHADGIPKNRFSERFFKISSKVSLTEYFSKKL